MRVSEDIAELVGMHVGDGTLYRTTWGIVWELRGALNEKEYYDYHVQNLLQRIFGIITSGMIIRELSSAASPKD